MSGWRFGRVAVFAVVLAALLAVGVGGSACVGGARDQPRGDAGELGEVVPQPAPPSAGSGEAVAAGPTEADLQVPTDPLAAAALLARAERQIRDPDVDDAVAARWGHVQQRVYRALAADDVLARAVERSMPDELKDVFAKTLLGTRQIGRTVTRPQVDLPDWRIVEPRPIPELKGYYEAAAAAHGVPWTVLAAIHLNETRMGRLRGTSPAGARGPMQFMPATWAAYGLGGDVDSDRDAIFGAANYVSRSGWAEDRRKAIWAYNHSDAYIDAILAFMELMASDPLAYRGYWGWQVYYRTIQGAIWLEAGYTSSDRMPIEAYCTTRTAVHCPPTH